jgi:branched-chain amino acid transport system ATP-binding protein
MKKLNSSNQPGANSAEPFLSIKDLCSGYGRISILSKITLHVSQGQFVSILGHNGMGKTTLLRTLMGYLPVSAGSIILRGEDISHRSTTQRARAGLGYVPQGREIFPNLSVYENLRMGCLLSCADEKTTIEEILTFFPRLRNYFTRLGGSLSGGEQQLLALARCLCAAPRLVLLDEPTEGIQPSIISEMISILKSIGKQRGLTVLLVEQNLEFIAALSHRILILQKGEITREISPDVAHNPEMIHEFVGMGPSSGIGGVAQDDRSMIMQAHNGEDSELQLR